MHKHACEQRVMKTTSYKKIHTRECFERNWRWLLFVSHIVLFAPLAFACASDSTTNCFAGEIRERECKKTRINFNFSSIAVFFFRLPILGRLTSLLCSRSKQKTFSLTLTHSLAAFAVHFRIDLMKRCRFGYYCIVERYKWYRRRHHFFAFRSFRFFSFLFCFWRRPRQPAHKLTHVCTREWCWWRSIVFVIACTVNRMPRSCFHF